MELTCSSADAVRRVRLALLVLALGVALAQSSAPLGHALHHAWYTSTSSRDLAEERCGRSDVFGVAQAPDVSWAVGPNPCAAYGQDAQRYLAANWAALRAEAATENGRRAGAARAAVLADLGTVLQRNVIVIAATIAACILAPLFVVRRTITKR